MKVECVFVKYLDYACTCRVLCYLQTLRGRRRQLFGLLDQQTKSGHFRISQPGVEKAPGAGIGVLSKPALCFGHGSGEKSLLAACLM
jgi:hypothetical protein